MRRARTRRATERNAALRNAADTLKTSLKWMAMWRSSGAARVSNVA